MNQEQRIEVVDTFCRVNRLIHKSKTLAPASFEHFNELVSATLHPIRQVVSIESYDDPKEQLNANLEGLKEILGGLKRLLTGKPKESEKELAAKMDEFRRHIRDETFIERMSLKFGEIESKEYWARMLTLSGKAVENLPDVIAKEIDFFYKEIKGTFGACDSYLKWSKKGEGKEPPNPSENLKEPSFQVLGSPSKTNLLERAEETDAPFYQFSNAIEKKVILPYPDKELFLELVKVQIDLSEKLDVLSKKYFKEIEEKYEGEYDIWDVFGYMVEIIYRFRDIEHALVSYLMASINKEKDE